MLRCRRTTRPLWGLAVLGFCLLTAGCAPFEWNHAFLLPGFQRPDDVPERVTDIWSYAVLHQSGLPGVRGFGGRIMFHTRGEDRPVRADGTLIVYAFDESSDDPAPEKPERKFVFPAEKFQDHYSQSELGHSYSVWLPWDELGGLERRITLISRFETAGGQVVVGEPSSHVLPGRKPDSAEPMVRKDVAGSNQRVLQASHETPARSLSPLPITALTLDLPPSFARQVFANPDYQAPSKPTLEMAGESSLFSSPQSPGPITPPQAVRQNPHAAVEVPQPEQGAFEGGTAWAEQTEASRPAGFALPRFPARRERVTRPRSARVRTTPLPAMWPSRLPMTPRSSGLDPSQRPTPSDASATLPAAEPDWW